MGAPAGGGQDYWLHGTDSALEFWEGEVGRWNILINETVSTVD
jgi:hypothetical protein